MVISEEIKKVPFSVKHKEMRRDWWVAYRWECVTELGSQEPIYLRGILRPFEEVIEAGKQFDEAWRTQSILEIAERNKYDI